MYQYLGTLYLLETFKERCKLRRVFNHGATYFDYCYFHKPIEALPLLSELTTRIGVILF